MTQQTQRTLAHTNLLVTDLLRGNCTASCRKRRLVVSGYSPETASCGTRRLFGNYSRQCGRGFRALSYCAH